MTTREVWPNAPLALVAVEARFPGATVGPPLPPVHRAVRELLGEGWVIEGAKQQTVELALGSQGVQTQNVRVEDVTRITLRDRTQAVTIRAESITVEATSYGGYEHFRELLTTVFTGTENVIKPDGITRLGIRYIDEISVPDFQNPDPWDDWIDRSLLAPRVEGLVTRTWTGAVQYDIGVDRRMVLRYGPADGPVVDPSGPLKRPHTTHTGLVFMLDFDSFWVPDDIPAFSASEIVVACDELRAPIRGLFDQLVSQRLIDEVFRMEAGR